MCLLGLMLLIPSCTLWLRNKLNFSEYALLSSLYLQFTKSSKQSALMYLSIAFLLHWGTYLSRALAKRVQDSVLSIATHCGLDYRGLNPGGPSWGPTQPTVQWVPAYFPGDEAAGAWHWSLTALAPKLRMSRPIPLLSLCACVACYGETFIFTLTEKKWTKIAGLVTSISSNMFALGK